MIKKITAFLMSASVLFSFTGCSGADEEISDESETVTATSFSEEENETETLTLSDDATSNKEGAVKHISPMEKITVNTGTQVKVGTAIGRENGSNSIKLRLADFIREGDYITSFTFVIRSDGGNIGEFKGGYGISLTENAPVATDNGNWFQYDNFIAPTQGSYGEITLNVPSDVAEYVNPDGELFFGYYWGNTTSILLDDVICTYTRTKNVPVDGTCTKNVGTKLKYGTETGSISISDDFVPEGCVPKVVTYRISSTGNLRKFNGSVGFNSSTNCLGPDAVTMFVNGVNAEISWFVPDATGSFEPGSGEYMFDYWWSEQQEICLDSVTVKYCSANTASNSETVYGKPNDAVVVESVGFRTAKEIVSAIKVGWNLGNSLDSYNTGYTGLDTEVGWGNVRTTPEIIKSVKYAGFNAIRIPVTWGEHLLPGNKIDDVWLNRVKEVVDYAYNEGLFVIINMHHDDYIWFNPSSVAYNSDSKKLKEIWKQISEKFKDYDDRLLFEGMDEPRNVGSSKEWIGGTADERRIVNEYAKDFVNAVRETGGKNAERTLIVTSYAASCEAVALDDMIVPGGQNIIFSVHFYAPWQFSSGVDTTFDLVGQSELASKFSELKSKFVDNGIPVIIDEFGCVNVADAETRAAYYNYYITAAKSKDIKCFVWDNGIVEGKDGYAILERESLDWNIAVLEGIMDGAGD